MRVCGKNVFNELDLSRVRKVLLSPNFKDKDILDKIKSNRLKYVITDSKIMDKMIPHNQGIIIEINDYEYKTIEDFDNKKNIIYMWNK